MLQSNCRGFVVLFFFYHFRVQKGVWLKIYLVYNKDIKTDVILQSPPIWTSSLEVEHVNFGIV